MKNKLRQSIKNQQYYQHFEITVKLARHFIFVCSKKKIPFEKYKYFRLSTNKSYRSFTTICLFSNRTKSVTKNNFGRNFFRFAMSKGLLNTFRKATW